MRICDKGGQNSVLNTTFWGGSSEFWYQSYLFLSWIWRNKKLQAIRKWPTYSQMLVVAFLSHLLAATNGRQDHGKPVGVQAPYFEETKGYKFNYGYFGSQENLFLGSNLSGVIWLTKSFRIAGILDGKTLSERANADTVTFLNALDFATQFLWFLCTSSTSNSLIA